MGLRVWGLEGLGLGGLRGLGFKDCFLHVAHWAFAVVCLVGVLFSFVPFYVLKARKHQTLNKTLVFVHASGRWFRELCCPKLTFG